MHVYACISTELVIYYSLRLSMIFTSKHISHRFQAYCVFHSLANRLQVERLSSTIFLIYILQHVKIWKQCSCICKTNLQLWIEDLDQTLRLCASCVIVFWTVVIS